MMSDYPPPASALMVWLDAEGSLMARFPPEPGHDKGHVVTFRDPAHLVRVLAARRSSTSRRIGTPAAPTQYDLDKIAHQIKMTTVVKVTEKKPKGRKAAPVDPELLDLARLLEEEGLI